MEKIDFVNNNAPYLSAETLNQMQDNIEEAISPNIITAGLVSNVKLTTTNNTKLPLSARANVGDKLTISNGGIKIGAGVTYVKVSGQVYVDTSGGAGIKKGIIYKNNNQVATDGLNGSANAYTTIAIPTFLLQVAENDIIYLYGAGYVNDNFAGNDSNMYNRLTVEVIK